MLLDVVVCFPEAKALERFFLAVAPGGTEMLKLLSEAHAGACAPLAPSVERSFSSHSAATSVVPFSGVSSDRARVWR